jgi:hypothetical protein
MIAILGSRQLLSRGDRAVLEARVGPVRSQNRDDPRSSQDWLF